MLVNKNNEHSQNVEFVSYTGKFPNLCSGVLTLRIDGENVKFGHSIEDFDWQSAQIIAVLKSRKSLLQMCFRMAQIRKRGEIIESKYCNKSYESLWRKYNTW